MVSKSASSPRSQGPRSRNWGTCLLRMGREGSPTEEQVKGKSVSRGTGKDLGPYGGVKGWDLQALREVQWVAALAMMLRLQT